MIHLIFGIALAALAACGGASIADDPRYSIGTRLLMGTITVLSMALIALIAAGFTWLVMGGLLGR